MGPVLESSLELLLDQQPSKSRAIDEKIAGNPSAVRKHHRVDVAAFAVALDRDDPALLADHSALLGEPAQETRIKAGVKMEGVGQGWQRAVRRRIEMREAVGSDGQRVEHVMAERPRDAELEPSQPIMMEWNHSESAADQAERVD